MINTLFMPHYKGGKERIAWQRTDKNAKSFDSMVKYFRNAGMDDATIAGIIGNFIQESGYNLDWHGDKYGRYGYGHMTKKDWDTMRSVYGDNQLKYYVDHATGKVDKKYRENIGYKQGRMKSSYTNPEEAAYDWMQYFERPVVVENGKVVPGKYQNEAERKAFAKDVYKYLQANPVKRRAEIDFSPTDIQDVQYALQKPVYDAPVEQLSVPQYSNTPLRMPMPDLAYEEMQPSQFQTTFKRGKDLYMPRYDEGKDDEDTNGYLTQEDIDFSKNWLINQLTNRKGTFVDTSYEDDTAGHYDYAYDFDKQYSDYLYNQTTKDWLNSKKSLDVSWMDDNIKNIYNQYMSANPDSDNYSQYNFLMNELLKDYDESSYEWKNDNSADLYSKMSELNLEGDEYDNYYNTRYSQLRNDLYRQFKEDRWNKAIEAIRGAGVFNPFDEKTDYTGYDRANQKEGRMALRSPGGEVRGSYVRLVDKSLDPNNYVYINNINDVNQRRSSIIHELNHLGQSFYGKNLSNVPNYWDRWHERHSRAKELQLELGLNNGETFDLNDIRDLRNGMFRGSKVPNSIILDHELGNLSDDELLELLNFAYNDSATNQDAPLYANKGKDLKKPRYDGGKPRKNIFSRLFSRKPKEQIKEENIDLPDITVVAPKINKPVHQMQIRQLPEDSPYRFDNMLREQMNSNFRNYLLQASGLSDILNPFKETQLSKPQFLTTFKRGKDRRC